MPGHRGRFRVPWWVALGLLAVSWPVLVCPSLTVWGRGGCPNCTAICTETTPANPPSPHRQEASEPRPTPETLPVAVHDGRCEVVLPTDHPGEQYALVLGALGRGGPYRVAVHTEA